eukprot:SAG31_NODE_1917_length_6923_cov_8.914897_5_plen_264_part_00
MTRPRRAGRSRCCCSSRNRYDPEEVSAHGIAGATAKPKKAAGLSPSTRAHSGQADSTNSHAERLRFDGSGKDKSSVEGSSPCKVEAPVHSRSPGSIGSGHSSRVQNLHIPDVPRCRKKGEGKNTMVNIRKPRSFGADGWLKINLPDDEDTEWFRRVRNIVTSNPPSAAELGHTRTLEPTEIAPGIFLGDAIHAQVRGYFLVFVQLFEKYGTLIERYTALIEKVSALIGLGQVAPPGHYARAELCDRQRDADGGSFLPQQRLRQ